MVLLVVVVVKVVVVQVVAVVVVVVELLVIVVVAAVPTTAAVHVSSNNSSVHVYVAMVVAMAKPFNPDHRETQNLHLFIFVKVHVCGHTCTVNKNTAHNTV